MKATKARRLKDEKDHEDYYDRYHNFPDDPDMALVPGSAAFRKRNGENIAASRFIVLRQPEYDLENEPNGNVRPQENETQDVDGNC